MNYTEWLAATMMPSSIASERAIKQVFRFFDIDNSGTISREELRQVLGDDSAVNKVLSRGDTSGDGLLSEKEFTALMLDVATNMGKDVGLSVWGR